MIVLVVAKNADSFLNYLKSMHPETINYTKTEGTVGEDRYIYMSNPTRMRGFHGVRVEFWDESWARDDYEEFRRLAPIVRLP